MDASGSGVESGELRVRIDQLLVGGIEDGAFDSGFGLLEFGGGGQNKGDVLGRPFQDYRHHLVTRQEASGDLITAPSSK